MKLFGLTGTSGSGKTELILKLINHFNQNNINVSIIKHAHHNFDIDKPNKDSFQYRKNGAVESMISSQTRWAIIHENKNQPEENLKNLISHMQKVDLILVEGFKQQPIPKIEVWRKNHSQNPIATQNNKLQILAITTPKNDMKFITYQTIIPIENINEIAQFIVKNAIETKDFTP